MLLQQPTQSALPVWPPDDAATSFEETVSTSLPSYRLTTLTAYVDWPQRGDGGMALGLWSAPRHLAPADSNWMPLPGDVTLPPNGDLPARVWSPLLRSTFVPQPLAGADWVAEAVASWRAPAPSTPPPRYRPAFTLWGSAPRAHKGNHEVVHIHFPWGTIHALLPRGWGEPEVSLALTLTADDATVSITLDFDPCDDPRTLAAFEASSSLAARAWASGPDRVPQGWQARYRTKDVVQKWGLVRFLSLSQRLVTLRIESLFKATVCEAAQSLTLALEPLLILLARRVEVRGECPVCSQSVRQAAWGR